MDTPINPPSGDFDKGLFWGYVITIKALADAGIHIPIETPLYTILQDVAEGRLALGSTPAEIARKFPEADPAFLESMNKNANLRIAKERDIAQRLLAYLLRER